MSERMRDEEMQSKRGGGAERRREEEEWREKLVLNIYVPQNSH